MDEKTTNYVNSVIATLTKQRNAAMDANVKLEAQVAALQTELNALTKKEEPEVELEAKAE
jgi:hypothetical protein